VSLGSILRGAAHTVGTVGKYAAPALALTGIGAPIAAGLGAVSAGLSHVGQKGATIGSALRDAALTGGGTYALGKIAHAPGGVSGTLGRAANWLGDPKAGTARIAGLTGLASTGLGAMGAGQAQAATNEQAGYERTRTNASDQQRAALMDLIMKHFSPPATVAA
jgi:hypothetical protein